MKPTERIAPAFGLTVAWLLRQRPQLARVFIRHRMACPGCVFSNHHSLMRALEIYSLPRSAFDEALAKIELPHPACAEESSLQSTKEEVQCDSDT